MQTVVGLTHSSAEAKQAVRLLQENGFAPASVDAAHNLRSVWRALVCKPVYVLVSHLAVGAVMGIALFAYLGVLIAAGGNALGYTPRLTAGALAVLAAAGGAVGAAIGLYVGLGDYAGQARFCWRSLVRGGALAVVRTADEHAPRAAAILRQAGLAPVSICPAPGVRPFWQRQPSSTDRLSLWTRWAARLLGVALLIAVALIVAGKGVFSRDLSALYAMRLADHVLLVALLLALAGVLIAWRWEGAGGLIIVASILLLQSVDALSGGQWRPSVLDPLFYLTGLLFLWDWRRTEAGDKTFSLPNL